MHQSGEDLWISEKEQWQRNAVIKVKPIGAFLYFQQFFCHKLWVYQHFYINSIHNKCKVKRIFRAFSSSHHLWPFAANDTFWELKVRISSYHFYVIFKFWHVFSSTSQFFLHKCSLQTVYLSIVGYWKSYQKTKCKMCLTMASPKLTWTFCFFPKYINQIHTNNNLSSHI